MPAKELLSIGAAIVCSLYISLFPVLIVGCVRQLIQGWRLTGQTDPAATECPAPDWAA